MIAPPLRVSSLVRERDVPWMNVQQHESRGPPKHLSHVQRISRPAPEHFRQSPNVLVHHVLFKIRHLVRSLRAREIQQKRPLDN